VGEESDFRRELERAHATIASQAMQIHQLEEAAQRESGLDALREILQMSEIVGEAIGQSPYRALLQGILQAARRLFDAAAASVALLDHDANELVFEAATDAHIVGLRFPAHQGIAGWVVMTGEPLVVSDVQRDPRFAQDFAQSTGYVPRSILAVPLMVREDVEGVLSVLDKANNATFGLDDMEAAALFARPAAVAVEQARMVSSVGTMLVAELSRLASERGNADLTRASEAALAGSSSTAGQTLELARLVHRLGQRGERATQLAIDVLSSVARYTR
jgi:signal transduction protein with GAF and PtsI domain